MKKDRYNLGFNLGAGIAEIQKMGVAESELGGGEGNFGENYG